MPGRLVRYVLLMFALSALAPPALTSFGLAQVEVTRGPLDSFEVRYYSKARTVLDWSPGELIHTIPELKKLQPAQTQAGLSTILTKTGTNVGAFFRDFPNTTSIEQIQQQMLDPNGSVRQQQIQRFHYLILANHEQGGPVLEEYRTDNKGRRIDRQTLKGGFLLTQGFAADSIFFDPAFQPNNRFRYLGQEIIRKRKTAVVAFAQNPKARTVVERAQMGAQSAVILVQGVAWIDLSNYHIIRLRTELLAPPPYMELEKQTTEIDYGQVRFKGVADTLWLPRQVIVTIEWNGQSFRNISSYSKYQLFKVHTNLKMHASLTARSDP